MNPETYKLFYKRIVNLVKDLQELKNTERVLFAKLRKREIICHSLAQNIEKLDNKQMNLEMVNSELKSTRILLKNIN
jgi:hypothetical protein